MKKRGKFNLLSYFVEKCLIFYNSKNQNKIIIAFAIIKSKDYLVLIPILEKYLKIQYINYFSIQIKIEEQIDNCILLNFRDTEKTQIIKVFNIIYYEITKNNEDLVFLEENELETKFLDLILIHSDSSIRIKKSFEEILFLQGENVLSYFRFYDLDFYAVKNNAAIIQKFLSLTKSFKVIGYLIINFEIGLNEDLIFSSYLIEINQKTKHESNIEKDVNSFFECNLLNKNILYPIDIFHILWRTKISESFPSQKNVKEIFSIKRSNDTSDLDGFNTRFEMLLRENRLKFVRISKNLLFIEETYLFFTVLELEYKVILNLLKRYYRKYYIFIISLSDQNYQKLKNIDKITLLERISILNLDMFSKFDINILKNQKN